MADNKKQYEDKRSALAAKLKKQPDSLPIQEVRPVPSKPATEEVRINFNVPVDFARRLKVHAAESGTTIKDLMMKAYESYLTQLSK